MRIDPIKHTLFITLLVCFYTTFSQVDVIKSQSRLIIRLSEDSKSNKDQVESILNNKDAKKCVQVYLYCGTLNKIPEEIFKLKWAEELYVEGDSLSEVSGELLQLKNLRVLYFGATKIASFAKPLQFPKLEKFEIYSSRLIFFPSGICECKKLTFLGLNRSLIKSIPYDISKLEKLEYLGLTDNQIYEFPKSLFNCTTLKYLILESNELKEIPDDIAQLVNLEELDLILNPIQSYSKKMFEFKKLNYLFYGWHPQGTDALGVQQSKMDNYNLTWKRCSKAMEAVKTKKSLGKPGGTCYMLFMGFSAEKILKAAASEKIQLNAAEVSLREQTAIVKTGLGKAVTLENVWGGKLKAGAVLGLRGKGNKPAIFVEYIKNDKNEIIGITYLEEGNSKVDGRINYQTYKDVHSSQFLDLEFPNEIVRATNFN